MIHDPGLLRAILHDPYNDALRLVYADWLDEHGDPDRAEFIRLQIELDPYIGMLIPKEFGVQVQRVQQLATKYIHVQEHPWSMAHPMQLSIGWRRGFPWRVIGNLQDWHNNAAALLRTQPITSLRIKDRAPSNIRGGSGGRRTWAWFNADLVSSSPRHETDNRLPGYLFGAARRRNFTSADEAIYWASLGMVNFARETIGLPLLKEVPDTYSARPWA